MHCHCEVVIPDNGAIKEHVERAMAPFREAAGFNAEFDFDWYQIGGRYTGSKDGYAPESDPRNIEICDQCRGTGIRDDVLGRQARSRDPAYTCNGCDGKGNRVAWPTKWVKHDGDVIPVVAVPDDLKAYALILPNGEILVQKQWDGNVATALRARGITTGRIVTVDCHS